MKLRRPSLLWRFFLTTSIFFTILLALTGWFVRDRVQGTLSDSLRSEMRSSFRAYESLWQARAEMLSSVSLVLSNMSDVRRAFGTGDGATIADTASEIWSKISQSSALFLVTDPQGAVVASLGGGRELGGQIAAVRDAARNFPAQTAGFVLQNGRLYQMVVTPVYVAAGNGAGLLDVLVAGYEVDGNVAADLKARTASDVAFVAGGTALASTLDPRVNRRLEALKAAGADLSRVDIENRQYAAIGNSLRDLRGEPVGEIFMVRSFDAVVERIAALERSLILAWIAAILAAFAGSYLLARRILEPVQELDRAAERIARQEYDTRVPVRGSDELARLAETFNAMCGSIQQARRELIRQERISTIGRLSTSIVHDLRNPLAAIFGGAEMMMDAEMAPSQMQRLAGNIYRSSRAVMDLLQELVEFSRQRQQPPEACRLREIVCAAADLEAGSARERSVRISVDVADDLEIPAERARLERVFVNLFGNAIDAMPAGGEIRVASSVKDSDVLVAVEDTGPGIPAEVRSDLFQPFVSAGKKNGLGLGLALSRQTLLDHGGDLWADGQTAGGARFWLRLPRG